MAQTPTNGFPATPPQLQPQRQQPQPAPREIQTSEQEVKETLYLLVKEGTLTAEQILDYIFARNDKLAMTIGNLVGNAQQAPQVNVGGQ